MNGFSDAKNGLAQWLVGPLLGQRQARPPVSTALSASSSASTPDRGYLFRGGRTGILMIHGLGGTPIQLRLVAARLAQAGHTVFCPQIAGHCGSYEDLRRTGWHDWYGSVDKAHQRLKEECETIIVGGLSMGAVLALHLAAEHRAAVKGVVLFAPTLWLDGWGVPSYSRLFRLVTRKWCADLFRFAERDPYGIKDVRIRAQVVAAIAKGDVKRAGQPCIPGSTMLEFRWLVEAVLPKLEEIRQPTLIFHPRRDDRAGLSNATYLQRTLCGRVETVVLDDSYHFITLDRQRDLVAERTDLFACALAKRMDQEGHAHIHRLPARRKPPGSAGGSPQRD
jgi:carboxylesterase